MSVLDNLFDYLETIPYGMALIHWNHEGGQHRLLWANQAFRKQFQITEPSDSVPGMLEKHLTSLISRHVPEKPLALLCSSLEPATRAYHVFPFQQEPLHFLLIEQHAELQPGDLAGINQFLLHLQKSTQAFYWERDRNTLEFRYISPTAREWLPFDPSDPSSFRHRLENAIIPDKRDAYHSAYQEAKRNDSVHFIHYALIPGNESPVYCADLVVPDPGNNQVLRGITFNTTKWVTTRKQLDTLRRRYKILTDLVSDYAVEFEVNENNEPILMWATPGFERVTGYHPDEVRTREQRLRVVHPDDQTRFLDMTRQLIETGEPLLKDFRIIRKDGEIRWLRNYVYPIKDNTGRVVRILGTGQDVTEQRKLEETLREQSTRFRRLIDQLEAGVIVVEKNGIVTDINEIATAFLRQGDLDWPEYPNPPRDFLALIRSHPDWYPLYLALRKVNENTPLITSEIQINKKPPKILRWVVKWLPSKQNPQTGEYVFIGTDISESVLIRQQLHKVERIESVTRLTGGISHILNNLLMAIQGNLELIQMETRSQPGVYRHVLAAKNATQQAAEVVRKLLSYARRRVGESVEINLNQFLKKYEPHLLDTIRSPFINLEFKLGWEDLILKLDPQHLLEILTQLVSNAARALNERGTIRIETGTMTITPDVRENYPFLPLRTFVYLKVMDNGPGIHPSILPHIFEPFYPDPDQGLSTRLGLATVYGLVKQNGGYILVDSQPEQGTTFTIFFPPAESRKALAKPRRTPLQRTILLVEDDPLIQDVIFKALNIHHYHTLIASTAQEALNQLVEHAESIALAIIDVIMARSNPTLIREFRSINPQLRFIYLNGQTTDELGILEIDDEKDIILTKPFSIETLITTVQHLLEPEYPLHA